MKTYEFDDKRFPIYAIIWAANESEARRVYSKSIYSLSENYYIPFSIDIDITYQILCDFFSKSSLDDCAVYISANSVIESLMRSKSSIVLRIERVNNLRA